MTTKEEKEQKLMDEVLHEELSFPTATLTYERKFNLENYEHETFNISLVFAPDNPLAVDDLTRKLNAIQQTFREVSIPFKRAMKQKHLKEMKEKDAVKKQALLAKNLAVKPIEKE